MTSPSPVALGRVAATALSWSLLNSLLAKFATVGVGVALARLLGPEEFGSFAVATVALLAVLSFNDLGISLAIVRWPGDPASIAPTVATLSVLSSSALFVASYCAAPHFAAAMGDPDSTGVVRLMSVCILLNGLVATPAALMQREFMQRRRTLIDQTNIWVGAIISVSLALGGMGAMSLAIGRVAATILSAALFVALAPGRLRFGFDRTAAPALLRFGLPLAGASAIVFAAGYADQLVVGTAFGSTQLGFYVLAFNLASWPVAVLSQPLRAVAPALFAKMQGNPTSMSSAFRSFSVVLACAALPLCAALSGAAEPIVEFVYGARWLPSAGVLRWLALAAALRILFELSYDYLVVLRRSALLLSIQLSWLVVLCPALVLAALRNELDAVAVAQLVVASIVAVPLYAFGLNRDGIDLPALARGLAVPAFIGAVLWLVSIAVSKALHDPMTACLVCGGLTITAVALLLHRNRLQLTLLRNSTEAVHVP